MKIGDNLLLIYSKQLANEIELLCKSIQGNSNTVFQIRKSSSSVYANIMEAQYPQSLPDMLSKFKIALKEASETGYWLELLHRTNYIDEVQFKSLSDKCATIRVMLIASCRTAKENMK